MLDLIILVIIAVEIISLAWIIKIQGPYISTNQHLFLFCAPAYFENIDFLEIGENGKPLYNAKDVAINLEKVGSIVESLDKLENKIKKEIKTDSRVRGGGDIGLYER